MAVYRHMVSAYLPGVKHLTRLPVLCRSCVQQAAEAVGTTASAEWQSLSSLLAQLILAHVPSLPEHSSRDRVVLLTHQLLRATPADSSR